MFNVSQGHIYFLTTEIVEQVILSDGDSTGNRYKYIFYESIINYWTLQTDNLIFNIYTIIE